METDKAEELVEYLLDDPTRVKSNLPEIENLLGSENEEVRVATIEGLSWIAKDHSVQLVPILDSIFPSLNDESKKVRAGAAAVISGVARNHQEEVYPVLDDLRGMLSSDYPDCRVEALKTFSYICKEYPEAARDIVPDAHQSLKTDNTKSRLWAAKLMSQVSEKYPDDVLSTIYDLRPLLYSNSQEVRLYATQTFANISKKHPSDILPITDELRRLLHDDKKIRREAIDGLLQIAEEYPRDLASGVPDFETCLEYNNTKSQALMILIYVAKNSTEPVVPVINSLKPLLQDNSSTIRQNASYMVSLLAENHPNKLQDFNDDLENLLEEDDENIVGNARNALKKMS